MKNSPVQFFVIFPRFPHSSILKNMFPFLTQALFMIVVFELEGKCGNI